MSDEKDKEQEESQKPDSSETASDSKAGGKTSAADQVNTQQDQNRVVKVVSQPTQDADGCASWALTCTEADAKWFYGVGYELDDDGIPTGINLRRKTQIPRLDEPAKALLKTINEASVRIKIAFRNQPSARKYLFGILFDLTANGLFGPDPDPETAMLEFETFKLNVAGESDQLRRSFIRSTLKVNGWTIVLALVLVFLWFPMHSAVFSQLDAEMKTCTATTDASGNPRPIPGYCKKRVTAWAISLSRLTFPNWENLDDKQKESRSKAVRLGSNLFLGFLLALCGIAVGLILSGFLRNRIISYKNFDQLYVYRMLPRRYLILIGSLAIVLLILLGFDVFVVGVGNLTLNHVVDNGAIGLVVGLLCALSEPLVSAMVVRQMKPAESSGGES